MIRWLVIAVPLFLGSCGIGAHYVQATNSMTPTIGIGDHLGSYEVKSNDLNPIKRFDIVVYKSQALNFKWTGGDSATWFIHRVIGMPGERIAIRKGTVYINGQVLEEPFEHSPGGRDLPETQIPENEYFLLGDNRPNSMDGRFWMKPTISREDILGVITKIIKKEDYDNGKRW
ncbi:MAG: signal peptidase I [Acidobacteriota bacterium]